MTFTETRSCIYCQPLFVPIYPSYIHSCQLVAHALCVNNSIAPHTIIICRYIIGAHYSLLVHAYGISILHVLLSHLAHNTCYYIDLHVISPLQKCLPIGCRFRLVLCIESMQLNNTHYTVPYTGYPIPGPICSYRYSDIL